MFNQDQIRIIQAGSEIFAFDTIRWPEEAFEHPIVYLAEAMNEGSSDSNKVGWKWINRGQFEWLVKHYSCMVSYVGTQFLQGGHTFYCNNHKCWEKNGKDEPTEEDNYQPSVDLYEERII